LPRGRGIKKIDFSKKMLYLRRRKSGTLLNILLVVLKNMLVVEEGIKNY